MIYVNDILIVSKNQNEIIDIVNKFKQNFEIHEFDNISKYVELIKKYNISCSASTPISNEFINDKTTNPIQRPYQATTNIWIRNLVHTHNQKTIKQIRINTTHNIKTLNNGLQNNFKSLYNTTHKN
ncbi:hypothetical protein DERF_009180 [Dermatophagoides farinae]|uniref:Reverse transcriptase domain-containing protein n=1 Tax=Dermatophagoides farinae TaxID=6954 RepID=A0A922HW70_DERFA|nr:hypothetical protein DERF_009180 [Dermatophagoides farinae]